MITKKLLISFGVSENRIIEETKSMDTFENTQYTKEIANKIAPEEDCPHHKRLSYEKVAYALQQTL